MFKDSFTSSAGLLCLLLGNRPPVTSPYDHIHVQGSHRLEKYLNLEGFLEKTLKVKSALKSTEKSLKGLEKSLNSSIFCRT